MGSPAPNSSQWSLTPSRSAYPASTGSIALDHRPPARDAVPVAARALFGGADQVADPAQARPDRDLMTVEAEQEQGLGADEGVDDEGGRFGR